MQKIRRPLHTYFVFISFRHFPRIAAFRFAIEKALAACMSSLNNPGNAIIMEYRATQNRARQDIPMRHEARHDIVTGDLAMYRK
jgi:hypothetical protein